MRSTLVGLGLAALLPLFTAGTSEAQRYGGYRGGGFNGGRGGFAISTPNFSYVQGSRGGWGLSIGNGYGFGPYSTYGAYRGFGYPYGYGGYGYGAYRPYGGFYGYSAPDYGARYYAAPAYGYAAVPAYSYAAVPSYNYAVVPASTPAYQAYESAPQQSDTTMTMRVIVPDANARVWFEGQETQQRGTERVFVSPPLTPGHDYTYNIKALWVQDGKSVERTQQVNVTAGRQVMVDFNALKGVAPVAAEGTDTRPAPAVTNPQPPVTTPPPAVTNPQPPVTSPPPPAVTPNPNRDVPPPAQPKDRPPPRPIDEID